MSSQAKRLHSAKEHEREIMDMLDHIQIVCFGKYHGKLFKEVLEIDPLYCLWIRNLPLKTRELVETCEEEWGKFGPVYLFQEWLQNQKIDISNVDLDAYDYSL